MTAQDLKNAILQLAVQGKLVEQRSEEGSAEGLFKEILQEKITGLCYKEPSIADEEIPFDIPDTWKWVRINNIAVLYNGRAYSKAELADVSHKVSGLLLYARTDETIQPNNSYMMSGNKISVRTLDLSCQFSEIVSQSDSIVMEHFK